MKKFKFILIALLLLIGVNNTTWAEIGFSGEIGIEIENDNTYDSDDNDNELNDLYAVIEPAFTFSFSDSFSIESALVIEPVLDPEPRKDRAFKEEALFVEELKFNFEQERYSIYGGKFNPSFGLGWDLASGVYGADLAEDYEIAGMIGFGGAIQLDIDGKHILSINSFFADTSFLSDTTHLDTESLEKEDGGVSNTEDFSSFTITLDGEIIEDLNYHLGYRLLSEGEGDIDDETGLALGFQYLIELGMDKKIIPFIEYVSIDNAGGGTFDVSYFTASLAIEIEVWNIALAYTKRKTENDDVSDIDDYQYQISTGYAFENGINIDVAWKEIEEEDIKTNVVGIVIGYEFEY